MHLQIANISRYTVCADQDNSRVLYVSRLFMSITKYIMSPLLKLQCLSQIMFCVSTAIIFSSDCLLWTLFTRVSCSIPSLHATFQDTTGKSGTSRVC